MTAEVAEQSGNIRGVTVRWVEVTVEGHTVEQILLFDVTEAEAVHGRPFDDELDKHFLAGMFATDRISADGTMHKVASATSYVLDGKCMRTAKIEHCRDIQPMSAGWRIERADGKSVHREPWSCVPGTPPTSHGDLKAADDVTRFLRGVGERVISSLRDDQLKPDRKSWWAGSLGYGYRFYHLWYSRPPWDNWEMSYRTNVRRSDGNEPGTGLWHADAGFTYLKDKNEGLERRLKDLNVHDDQATRTDQIEGEDGRIAEEFGVIQVSRDSDALDEPFAEAMADTLRRYIEVITPVVDAFVNERNEEDV